MSTAADNPLGYIVVEWDRHDQADIDHAHLYEDVKEAQYWASVRRTERAATAGGARYTVHAVVREPVEQEATR